MQKLLLLTSILMLSMGCNDTEKETEKEGDTGTSTGDGGSGDGNSAPDFRSLEDNDILALGPANSLPGMMTFMTMFIGGMGDDTSCPSMAEDGDTTTISGGCSDEDGESWTGTAVFTEPDDQTFTGVYVGFGNGEFSMNGEVSGDADGVLTSNMSMTMTEENGSAASFSFVDHLTDNLEDQISMMFGEANSTINFSGGITLEDGAAFTVTGASVGAECGGGEDSEIVGVLDVMATGPTTVMITSVDDVCAEECVNWVNGDETGTVCL